MSDVVIKVENLSKSYLIGHQKRERYTALRDVVAAKVKSLGRGLLHPFKSSEGGLVTADQTEEFWALKDVSFEIMRGERVGIVGRNGAGKSTLLKILSRITEPTKGKIEIEGRVASLLEVGTGFHPELTGRENIFLNGAILGMTKAEIKHKFDEIVAFAEIERFLDTPVKRYSSGMYVRLAFAVAAHLEPEILIVDEVLAVGDMQFQKKCLGKMEDVGKEDRSVVFVSHNMDAIQRLCNKVLWVEGGMLKEISSEVSLIIKKYQYGGEEMNSVPVWINSNEISFDPCFDIKSVKLSHCNGEISSSIISKFDDINIEVEGDIVEINDNLSVGYAILSDDGRVVYWSFSTDMSEKNWPKLFVGKNRLFTKVPNKLLNEGEYSINIMVSVHNKRWIVPPGKLSSIIAFKIHGVLSESPFWYKKRPGIIAPVIEWNNFEHK